MDDMFDVIIIGAGPAGMTAALYVLRARMRTLVLDKAGAGGQAMIIDTIENYPAFPENASGFDWVSRLEAQLKNFDLKLNLEAVTSLEMKDGWTVKTDAGKYRARAVICATGAEPKRLRVPGEKEFLGKGVSYCATCDGAFFKGKHVVVVGGGNTAVKDALFLTRLAGKVTLVHRRDRLRAEKILQEKLLGSPQVDCRWNSIVTAIKGGAMVERIQVRNIVDGTEKDIACDGIFVLVGVTPETGFMRGVASMDEKGFIKATPDLSAGKPGLFAAGDCRQKLQRQIVTACGDGATAALAAQNFVDVRMGREYGEFKEVKGGDCKKEK